MTYPRILSVARRPGLILLLFAFLGTLLFLNQTGALHSDLGGDPDEAAHAVTSLMLRDYFTLGSLQSPMRFATEYYANFPKVAFGHYPPLYYLVAGARLIPFPQIQTLFVLQALLAAALAMRTFRLGENFLPSPLAALAGLFSIALPVTLKLSQHVMSDIMLAVLCLISVECWTAYLKAPSVKKALLFGCVAALAILTKGSGMLLCLLPPIATLLSGNWRLSLKLSWWCAGLPVALFAGPWMLYSTKISKEGMTRMTPLEYFSEAVPYYWKSLPSVFGWGLLILMAIGLTTISLRSWKLKAMAPVQASITAMTIGAIAVLLLIPVGLTTRYLLPIIPVALLAAALGAHILLAAVPRPWQTSSQAIFLVAAFTLAIGLPQKDVHGFSEAVSLAGVPRPGTVASSWLVSSDPRGEGAIIAAATFQIDSRSSSNLRVYRGSKELAASDWMGRDYKAAFGSEADLLNHLQKKHITCVFVDLSAPEAARLPHEKLLENALKSAPQTWQLLKDQPVSRTIKDKGVLLVYRAIATRE